MTHSQVVLLGQKDDRNLTRVMFLMKGTQEICIPAYFFCNEVVWEEGEQQKDVVFLAEDREYRVMCDHVWFEEDELEFNGVSPLIDERLF